MAEKFSNNWDSFSKLLTNVVGEDIMLVEGFKVNGRGFPDVAAASFVLVEGGSEIVIELMQDGMLFLDNPDLPNRISLLKELYTMRGDLKVDGTLSTLTFICNDSSKYSIEMKLIYMGFGD